MGKGIPPTVGNFILLLSSKLTQYDEKTSRRERHPNIYRLGHLLKASQEVEDEVLRHASKDDVMSQEIAEKMVSAMAGNFIVNLKNELDLSPVRNVVKQLDAFLASGKNPSLVG